MALPRGSSFVPEKGKPFEVYTIGHTDSLNPADWVTEIYLPIE